MTAEATPSPPAPSKPSVGRLVVAIAVTIGVVTAASYLTPKAYASTAVGLAFLLATHLLVLRGDAEIIRAHGLSLGGVLEPEPVDARRLLRAAARAVLVACVCFVIILVPFWFGYRQYNGIHREFSIVRAIPAADEILGQLFVVALPEEAFFRGYVQTQLDRLFPRTIRVATLPIGLSIIITSALFALCHLFTVPHVARLAVFFPSLLFGALRAREGGIGASVVVHALCNLLTGALEDGYAPAPR